MTNSGTISAGANGTGIFAGTTANVTNSGTISAGRHGISANTANVTSSGTISGGSFGINASTANVTSSGTISGGACGIFASTANVSSSGTISGAIGIRAMDKADVINSGTIIGTGGTALRLSGNADTLTLLSGSRIVGAIDMGGGNDVVSFRSDKDVAQLVTLKNFTGTINSAGSGPQVHSATQIATLDPTAFAQADRTLMDFTGGVSSLVRGRLGAQTPSGFATQAVSFAPEESSRAADRVSAAFAGVSSAMAYGADNKLVGKAIGKAPAADDAAPW